MASMKLVRARVEGRRVTLPDGVDLPEGGEVYVALPQGQAQEPEATLREIVRSYTAEYYEQVHRPARETVFQPGQTPIPYAGRVFGADEMTALADAALDFWLTAGPYTKRFERELASTLGARYALLVNSGSSANLLAFQALTSHLLKDRALVPGDEVITVAAGFPTTVFPVLQFGAVPVFVDVRLEDGTYNIDTGQLEAALSQRTRAVMVAHTLGNPFDLNAVTAFCRRHDLWLVEDNCDALGSRYDGKLTGSFGDLGTSSFYPPHHITMGEGGAVYTSNSHLKRAMESIRDWGRDCWCPPGKDNTCGKRFEWELGQLPRGYDHKYVYSHLGYNLKATDLQAAIGCVQLGRLDAFTQARRRNWQVLRDGLGDLEDRFILPAPTAQAEPSWFGFVLTVRPDAGFRRDELTRFLESEKIQTRLLFAGNLLRQPVFDRYRATGTGYRAVGELPNTDTIMRDTFWVGVYPGMQPAMLDYMVDRIRAFCAR